MSVPPVTTPRARLDEWMATLSDLDGAINLLDWDRETAMPPGGADARSRQVATLSALRHRETLRAGIDDDIAALVAADGLTDADRAALRLARRERDRASRLPEDLVRALSEAGSQGVTAWLATRESGDFATFAPALQRVVDLSRETGAALGIGDEPYDGLLDQFEPGTRAMDVESLFGELEPAIMQIVRALGPPDDPTPPTAGRDWPTDRQLALAREVAGMLGFAPEQGLIAVSAHPFTSSPHPGDVRFTTRFAADDPTSNMLVVLHEAGHALYAQGLPRDLEGSLTHNTSSLGADESQSRFFENHVGRSHAFWELMLPVMRRHFGAAMDGIGADALQRFVSAPRPGWCRVDADEVTYDLHIAMRFRLELAMIRDDLRVVDLPGAWREASESLLGITPADDTEGCMQDIHWAWGLIGYFPTYTLGNVYAAQLAEALERELGPLDALVGDGRFDTILAFMRERVHRHARTQPTLELMRGATGGPRDTRPLLRRLAAIAAPWT